MHRCVKVAAILIAIVLGHGATAQDKEQLQSERDRITKDISLTTKLIDETRKSRSQMEGELGLINKKIRLREDLINNLRKEINMFDRRIAQNEKEIEMLEGELEELKSQYAAMIRQAQKSNRAEDRLMYVFASEDFFQFIRRIRYMRQYAEFRAKQAREIVETQRELESKNEEIASAREEKSRVIDEQQSIKNELARDRKEHQSTVSELQSEEKTLVARLRKQEKQREELNKEIQRIIEAEIRASKKDNAGVFALTPEAAALSAEFENNRGKLPWPVERGVITQGFGNNPHPVLGGITVVNNGVNIATNKNAAVRAVFKGTVSGVFAIPGAGRNVIINHGGYRSVYSNLKEVYVAKGDEVEAKQEIGTVLTDETSGKTEAHLEIWKVTSSGTTKEDPARWIFRQ